MSALVWADMNRSFRRPESPPTRPVPLAVPSMEVLPGADTEPVTVVKKEVSNRA
jgi:hypothetical protein